MEGHTWEGLILMDRENIESLHDKVEYRKESVQETFQNLITKTCISFDPEDIHFGSTSSGEESVVSYILKNENEIEGRGHGEDSHFEDTSEGSEGGTSVCCESKGKEIEAKERDFYSENVDALIETQEAASEDQGVCIKALTNDEEPQDTSTVTEEESNTPKKGIDVLLSFCRRCEEGPTCCLGLASHDDGEARLQQTTSAGDERKDVRKCKEGLDSEGAEGRCAIDTFLIDNNVDDDDGDDDDTEGSVVSGEYDLSKDRGEENRREIEIIEEAEEKQDTEEETQIQCNEGGETYSDFDYEDEEDKGEIEATEEKEIEQRRGETQAEYQVEREYYSEEDSDYAEFNMLETLLSTWSSYEDNLDTEEEMEAESDRTQPYPRGPDTYYRCQEPLEVILEILGEEGEDESKHRDTQDETGAEQDAKTQGSDNSLSEDEETLCGCEDFSIDSLDDRPVPENRTTWSELARSTSGSSITHLDSDEEAHDTRALTRTNHTHEESISPRRSKSKPTRISTRVKGSEVSDRNKLRCLTSEIEEYLRETTLLLESATSYCTPRKKKKGNTSFEHSIIKSPKVMSGGDAEDEDTHHARILSSTATNSDSASFSPPHDSSQTNSPSPLVTRMTDDKPIPVTTGVTEASLNVLERLWAPITEPLNTAGSIEGKEEGPEDVPFEYPIVNVSFTPERENRDEDEEWRSAKLIQERRQSSHEYLLLSEMMSICQSLVETKKAESEYFSALEPSSDAMDALEWEERNAQSQGTSPVIYLPSQRSEDDDYFFTSLENAGDNWLAMYDEPGECLESSSLEQLSVTPHDVIYENLKDVRGCALTDTVSLSSHSSVPPPPPPRSSLSPPPPPPPRRSLPPPPPRSSLSPPPPPTRNSVPPPPPAPPRPPPPRPDSPPLTVSCLASLEKLCNTWDAHHDARDTQTHTLGFTELELAERVAAERLSEHVEDQRGRRGFQSLDKSSQSGVYSEKVHCSRLKGQNELISDNMVTKVHSTGNITGITDIKHSEEIYARRELEKENGTSHNVTENEKVHCNGGGTKQIFSQYRISARLEEIFKEVEHETCILTNKSTQQSSLRPTVCMENKNKIGQENNDHLTAKQREAMDLQQQLNEILNRMDVMYEDYLGTRNAGHDEPPNPMTSTRQGGNSGGRNLATQTLTQSSEKTAYQDILNISEDLKHICMFHVNKTEGEQYYRDHTTTITPAVTKMTATTHTKSPSAYHHTPDEVTTPTLHHTPEANDARRNTGGNYEVPGPLTRGSIRRQPEGGAVECPLPDEGAVADSSRLVRFLQKLRARNLHCYDLPLRYLKELLMYTADGDAGGAASAHYDSTKTARPPGPLSCQIQPQGPGRHPHQYLLLCPTLGAPYGHEHTNSLSE